MLSCLVYPTGSEKPFNQFVTEHSARTNAMPLEPFLAGDLSLGGRFPDLEADSKILLKSWNSRSAHSACSRSFPGPEIPRPSGSHCNSSFLHYMTPPLPSEDICICCKHEPGFIISPVAGSPPQNALGISQRCAHDPNFTHHVTLGVVPWCIFLNMVSWWCILNKTVSSESKNVLQLHQSRKRTWNLWVTGPWISFHDTIDSVFEMSFYRYSHQ